MCIDHRHKAEILICDAQQTKTTVRGKRALSARPWFFCYLKLCGNNRQGAHYARGKTMLPCAVPYTPTAGAAKTGRGPRASPAVHKTQLYVAWTVFRRRNNFLRHGIRGRANIRLAVQQGFFDTTIYSSLCRDVFSSVVGKSTATTPSHGNRT